MSKEIENPLDLGGNEEDAVASFIVLHEKKRRHLSNKCSYISQSP